MKDIIASIAAHGDAFRWVFFLCLIWFIYRVVEKTPGLEWREFITTKGKDGVYHPDLNRIGQCVGICVAAFVPVAAAPNAFKDFAGFALVLTACLGALFGVSAYAATLRARSGQVQTTIVSEPSSSPRKTTTTTTEPAPSKESPMPVEIVGGVGVEGEPLKVTEQPKGKP